MAALLMPSISELSRTLLKPRDPVLVIVMVKLTVSPILAVELLAASCNRTFAPLELEVELVAGIVVGIGTRVFVGKGTGVRVGGTGVLVGGTGVFVGTCVFVGTAVLVAVGTGVFVGTGVLVGGKGVFVGMGVLVGGTAVGGGGSVGGTAVGGGGSVSGTAVGGGGSVGGTAVGGGGGSSVGGSCKMGRQLSTLGKQPKSPS